VIGSRTATGLLVSWLAAGALVAAEFPHADAASAGVRFESGAHARIPFPLRNQHVWVRGRINDSDSLWIVIDTGASATVLDADLARSLGLRTGGRARAMGAGGPQEATLVKDVTVRLPGLSFHRPQMTALPLTAVSGASPRPLQVVVGHELFESCVVRLDYAAGIMDVWDAKNAPKDLAGVEIPLTFEQGHPYVDGVLHVPGRRPLSGRFVLDTGSSLGLAIHHQVAKRESLASAFPRTLATMGRGVGGEVRSIVGRATAFTLGGLRFQAPVVVMQETTSGAISAPGTIGNVGGQLLGRCRATFDYRGRRLRLEPAAGFDRPWEADMSGLVLLPSGKEWSVRAVNPDTPAAEAGIRAGDVLLALDGEPVERLELWTVRQKLQQEGREVRLDLRRGDERSTVTLRLRRLI
jgi:predicted aspartyl protease